MTPGLRERRPLTHRRVLLWFVANVVLVVVGAMAFVIWPVATGPRHSFVGPDVSASGGMLSIGRVMSLVGGTLLVANLAWALITVARRR